MPSTHRDAEVGEGSQGGLLEEGEQLKKGIAASVNAACLSQFPSQLDAPGMEYTRLEQQLYWAPTSELRRCSSSRSKRLWSRGLPWQRPGPFKASHNGQAGLDGHVRCAGRQCHTDGLRF